MKKLIITYDEGAELGHIIDLVAAVIKHGKVSNATVGGRRTPHFCWATTFKDDWVVTTRRKDHQSSPDSFHVSYEPGPPNP